MPSTSRPRSIRAQRVVDADGTVTFRATDPDAKTITAELQKAGA